MLWNELRPASADMELMAVSGQRVRAGEVAVVPDVFSSVDTFQPPPPANSYPDLPSNRIVDENDASAMNQRSSSSTTRSRSTSGDDVSTGSKGDRYKTEMCRTFSENGSCRYGDKCQFAHGLSELRVVSRHPKYKTDLCRTFHSTGFCPYGTRCHFIHAMNESKMAAEDAPAPPPQSFIRPSCLLSLPTASQPTRFMSSTVLKNNDPNTDVLAAMTSAQQRQRLPPYSREPSTDVNANILADLLRAMKLGQQRQPAAEIRSTSFGSSCHPMSPTHSLDSTAYSSDHSLSPCPSPTEDLFVFPSTFSYPSQAHPLSPSSGFSSISDVCPVWPSSLIPGLSMPFQATTGSFPYSACQNPFTVFAESC